ncbi:MAG: hypothetical protein ACRDRW_16955 [Pseudonocardiaceae bacterium]
MIRSKSRTAVPHPTLMKEAEGDHVNISPERDAPPRGPVGGLRSGSGASWRYAAQSPVTLPVLVGALLVCLGLLLGSTWTAQALQSRSSQQAEERRRLNEEWLAVRAALQQRDQCPRCGRPLSEHD